MQTLQISKEHGRQVVTAPLNIDPKSQTNITKLTPLSRSVSTGVLCISLSICQCTTMLVQCQVEFPDHPVHSSMHHRMLHYQVKYANQHHHFVNAPLESSEQTGSARIKFTLSQILTSWHWANFITFLCYRSQWHFCVHCLPWTVSSRAPHYFFVESIHMYRITFSCSRATKHTAKWQFKLLDKW